MDRDPGHDLDLEQLRIDLERGSVEPGAPDPPSPSSARERGRPGGDHLLGRSPWYLIPLVISLIIGVERVLMLSFVPGWRSFGVTLFGALFVLTFTLVLAAGGLYIQRYRGG